MRKLFPWKALAQRTPLLMSGFLFLPSFIHLIYTQQVFIKWTNEIIFPLGKYPTIPPSPLNPSRNWILDKVHLLACFLLA